MFVWSTTDDCGNMNLQGLLNTPLPFLFLQNISGLPNKRDFFKLCDEVDLDLEEEKSKEKGMGQKEKGDKR